MRAPAALGLALATACALAGCASGTEPGMPNVLEPHRDPRNVIVYVYESTDEWNVDPVLYPVDLPVTDGPTVETAVETLTTYEPKQPYGNSWNTLCAPGKDLDQVIVTKDLITVHFNEHSGTTCDMSQAGVDALEQQLAWTVATATDSYTPVRVTVGRDAYVSLGPVTANEKFLAPPSKNPTSR